MTATMPYHELVDAIDQLPTDVQRELIILMRHRIAQRERDEMLETIREARAEYERGEGRIMTVDEIMAEVTP